MKFIILHAILWSSFSWTSAGLQKTLFSKEEGQTSHWFNQAGDSLKRSLNDKQKLHPAKNVIMFLGDGMGITPNTAGRIYRGQKENLVSEQTPLSWETFPHTAIVKTYALDYHTTDSASSATSFLCGSKAQLETVGLGAEAEWNKCENVDKNSIDSVAAWAVQEGKWVGVVTNTKITDATPAGTYAHSPNRYWQTDADIEDSDCKDIAQQLIQDFPGKDFRVILGGGRKVFLPDTTEDYEINYENTVSKNYGGRKDGKNLIDQWQKGHGPRKFVYSRTQLESVDIAKTDYLLGLFEYGHMEYQLLHDLANRTDNPTLEQMTKVAMQILSKSPKGFFLFVEGGMIDKSLHQTIAAKALEEVFWLHKSVAVADQMTDPDETLIVVTADHSHAISFVGYPLRNVSILGTFIDPGPNGRQIERNIDNLPTTLLVYANGPSAKYHNQTERRNLTDIDTEAADFEQPSAIPLNYETHGGEDVGLYARGPYSHIFTGSIENTYIAHAMGFALCAGPVGKPACINHKKRLDSFDSALVWNNLEKNRRLMIAAVVLSGLCLVLLFLLVLMVALFFMKYRLPKQSLVGSSTENSGRNRNDEDDHNTGERWALRTQRALP